MKCAICGKEHTKVYVIANQIKAKWKNISPYALPYLNAMLTFSCPTEYYMYDRGSVVILYFLSNAASFKGADASEIKQTLKAMTKNV